MKIQKIRSISEAVAAGTLRESSAYHGPSDTLCTRFDFFWQGKQVSIGMLARPADAAEVDRVRRWKCRVALNKWIQKHGALLSEMKAPPTLK